MGEVNNPGVITLPDPPTVTSCVATAGSFTPFANVESVGLVHYGSTNWTRIRIDDVAARVKPGDSIIVYNNLVWGANLRKTRGNESLPKRWRKAEDYYRHQEQPGAAKPPPTTSP